MPLKPIISFKDDLVDLRDRYSNFLMRLHPGERTRKWREMMTSPTFTGVVMPEGLCDPAMPFERTGQSEVTATSKARPISGAAPASTAIEQGAAVATPEPAKAPDAPVFRERSDLSRYSDGHPKLIGKAARATLEPEDVEPISPS